jgi:hypothetical protein
MRSLIEFYRIVTSYAQQYFSAIQKLQSSTQKIQQERILLHDARKKLEENFVLLFFIILQKFIFLLLGKSSNSIHREFIRYLEGG